MELKEPKLTYERILNDVSSSVQNDLITAACSHAKFIIVGYNSGRINVFDHQGNKVNEKDLCLHVKSVNGISIDQKGDYFVSCCNKSLVVYRLCDDTYNHHVLLLDKPINVVAIDPEGGRRYVTGDDKLTLHEVRVNYIDKLRAKEPLVLPGLRDKDRQPIKSLSWHGKFIACATEKSILVYYEPPRERNSIITRIKKDEEIVGQDPAQFAWRDKRTLLIGWGNTVKVCLIKDRPPQELNERIPRLYVEIVSMFDTDYIIHGLAPIGNDLLTLTYHSLDKSLANNELQVQVLEIFSSSYNELSGDLVKPRITHKSPSTSAQTTDTDPDNCSLMKSAKLLSLHQDGIYLIVCPQDIISAKPRDDDDHIDWLIEHELFEECHEFATENSNKLVRHSVREIKQLYMDHLLSNGCPDGYGKAAQLFASICDKDQDKWDEAIEKFKSLNQLNQLLPHLPRCLKRESYDLILDEFLRKDSISFFKAIKEFPSNLYSLKKITDSVINRLNNDPKNLVLNEALAELYTRGGKLEEAVQIYLDYNDRSKIFDLIRSNGLISSLEKNIDKLMQVDATETAQLLVENIDRIPMRSVVDRFKRNKTQKYLMTYLDRLLVKDPDCCIEYHDLMVKLYAEHQPESLLAFLKLSTSFKLEVALDICKSKNLIKEVVFLYSRMGDLQEALRYIVEEKGDVNEAIEFCKNHQDSELWDDLIGLTVDKRPDCIGILLKKIGTHIDDPSQLINRLPPGCVIDDMMQYVKRICQSYREDVEIEANVRELESKDAFELSVKQIFWQSQGNLMEVGVMENRLCDHCNQVLISDSLRVENLAQSPDFARPDQNSSDGYIAFGCHHVFHEDCCTDTRQVGADGPTLACRACMLERDDLDEG